MLFLCCKAVPSTRKKKEEKTSKNAYIQSTTLLQDPQNIDGDLFNRCVPVDTCYAYKIDPRLSQRHHDSHSIIDACITVDYQGDCILHDVIAIKEPCCQTKVECMVVI